MRKCVVALAIVCAVGSAWGTYDSYNKIMNSISNMAIEMKSKKDITWKKNQDNTYTFSCNVQGNNKNYAWQILDEKNSVIYKTSYQDNPYFVYDLADNRQLTIKVFVKDSTDLDGKHQTYRVNSVDVLGMRKFNITSNTISDFNFELLKIRLLAYNNRILSSNDLLNKDGSKIEVDLSQKNIDWSCKNVKNRSNAFALNGFKFLDALYKEYEYTKDDKLAKIITLYVLDWCKKNREYRENSWEWHDDATAERVKRMSIWYYEFKYHFSDDEQKIVENSLAYQAKLLSSKEFYTERHNHGMHQDIALIIYALLYADDKIMTEYISLATSRISLYLDYVFTVDGIHKEHSPFYSRDVVTDVAFLAMLLKDISTDFSQYLYKYVYASKSYFNGIIKPNGWLPDLGDSSPELGEKSIKIINLFIPKEATLDNGRGNGSLVFKDGGYGIFRSENNDADKGTWMLFNAATFSSTHKHGDDLEVLLYHRGDLFVEAGKRNYNYADRMTAWAYSGYAHNVLIVDDEAYPVKVSPNGWQKITTEALGTKITDYSITDDVSSITGYEHRFKDIEQTRTLTYDRVNNVVEINDVLKSNRNYNGTLLWHIAEGVKVVSNYNGWDFYRNDVLIASMMIKSDNEISLQTVTGDKQFPYTAWIFNGKDDPTYGTLLKVNFVGNSNGNIIKAIINLY